MVARHAFEWAAQTRLVPRLAYLEDHAPPDVLEILNLPESLICHDAPPERLGIDGERFTLHPQREHISLQREVHVSRLHLLRDGHRHHTLAH
jgi:hypothetical protein